MEQYLINNDWILWLILVWILPWKGMALWRAAENKNKKWFIVLFLVNTLAVLDLLYIFYFGKNKQHEK